ncbi:hypothetical protein KAW08_00065 [bacterium]|nr:hypothetical protein [bacterium]
MVEKEFDYTSRDSQGTSVKPMKISDFDIPKYEDYEASLLEKNRKFWNDVTGTLVYRRFRVPEVYSYVCKDKALSLAFQLRALTESMKYKADIANFLEPWYGIGVVGSSFGLNYIWNEGQSPATEPPFKNIDEALSFEPIPTQKTEMGKKALEMIEFFLDKTKGKIPISLTDTQSPFNTASYLVETNNFFMAVLDYPEKMKQLISVITDLLIDFTKEQINLIGDVLASPGHGFSSSREFGGISISDDNMTMLSPEQYIEIEVPFMDKVGKELNGAAFHSCGNWSGKIDAVKKIKNVVMVDGAFSRETDPDPNPAEPFPVGFAGTGIIVNVRVVGDSKTLMNNVRKLWKTGMKLIIVTYAKHPAEQEDIYKRIQEICS